MRRAVVRHHAMLLCAKHGSIKHAPHLFDTGVEQAAYVGLCCLLHTCMKVLGLFTPRIIHPRIIHLILVKKK